MRRHLFAVLCMAAAVYVVLQAWSFCAEVLQVDFSAYATAAEAVRFGLDPYRTHPDHEPPVWDGKAAYAHSRFLYPPLVADLFLPFALVPYRLAKVAFTALSLGALVAAVLLTWRRTRPNPATLSAAEDRERLCLVFAFLFTAYPVLTLLERGQVDAFTLLLLVVASSPALRGSRPGVLSGFLLALATLLKLNAAYFAAFWVLRRWWRGLLGFGFGAALLIVLSAALDGTAALGAYLRTELPRIARYGEEGSPSMRLPSETSARLRGDAPEGFARRDGRLYRIDGFGFVANASGARVLARALGAHRARSWFTGASLLIVGLAVGFLAWALRSGSPWDTRAELAYLSATLAAVLLAGPLTWTMNAVWLAVASILLARTWPPGSAAEAGALLGLGLGLLLAWIPDQYALRSLFAAPPRFGDYKYVAAEVLVLVSLGFWLRGNSIQHSASGIQRRGK